MNMAETKSEKLYKDVVMAGFGGQGLMFIGKLLAYSAMKEGRHVTWIPSYGPEMRGGTANCTVVISNEEIGSPVTTHPQAAIIMNNPSFEAFEPRLQIGGLLLFNSSMVNRPIARHDLKMLPVPATEIATSAGTEKAANMVMLGTYIALTRIVSKESVISGLKELFGKKLDLFEVNMRALEEGMKFASKQLAK
jgi:2-oxoglutarate ferredoxin oxidoreductase subunit gamma